MKLSTRLAGLAVATLAVSGLSSATTASASDGQGLGCNYYHFVNADALRVRASPSGTILGLSWYGTRVQLLERKGAWQHVTFPRRSEIAIRSGWVAARYVGYYDRGKIDGLCPY